MTLLLLTERGEILRLTAADVTSVRPTDPAHAARLRSALESLSVRGAQTRRLLRVLAQSLAPVTLGYVAETPIWRTTYRLVLGAKEGGVLQGWALVHNDTDEDWRGVTVSLVNGRPDSFLFPLAAPRYARRQLVPPAEELATVPQLLDTTVDTLWGDHLTGTETGEARGYGGLGLIGHGSGGGSGSGYGVGIGSVSGRDAASSLLAVGDLAAVAKANAVEAGALFSYTLAEPLSLRAHGSALVPIVQEPIDAQPITWVAQPGSPARMGIRLTNSTGQTLPVGPIALFADGGFAGEAALDRLKPGERRFLQFGMDLDLELTRKQHEATEEPREVTFRNDVLVRHYVRRSDAVYVIENRGGQPRTVYLALKVVSNAKVTGADALDYDEAASQPVAILKVPARTKVERALHVEEGLAHQTALGRLEAAALRELATKPTLPAAARAILVEAAARQEELERARHDLEKARASLTELQADINRLREHLRAAGGEKGAGAAPLVGRVLAAEDRLTALRLRIEALDKDIVARRAPVRAALAKLPR
jgi:hypothetical protein